MEKKRNFQYHHMAMYRIQEFQHCVFSGQSKISMFFQTLPLRKEQNEIFQLTYVEKIVIKFALLRH